MRTCGNCRFFELVGPNFGQCRYNPPIVFLLSDGDSTERSPEVATSQWCGKFETKALSALERLRASDPLDPADEVRGKYLSLANQAILDELLETREECARIAESIEEPLDASSVGPAIAAKIRSLPI